jgi:hypothetical protein
LNITTKSRERAKSDKLAMFNVGSAASNAANMFEADVEDKNVGGNDSL